MELNKGHDLLVLLLAYYVIAFLKELAFRVSFIPRHI